MKGNNDMLAGLKKAWLEEPILTRAAPVLTALVAYFVTKYVHDAQLVDLLIALGATILGGGGLLGARAAVKPLAKLPAVRPVATPDLASDEG